MASRSVSSQGNLRTLGGVGGGAGGEEEDLDPFFVMAAAKVDPAVADVGMAPLSSARLVFFGSRAWRLLDEEEDKAAPAADESASVPASDLRRLCEFDACSMLA